MKLLFLSISTAVSDLDNRGIYPDLLRKFANEGHEVYIVAPIERRYKVHTYLNKHKNVSILLVKTLNTTKSNIIEKGISMFIIQYLFEKAIRKYLKDVKFDMVLSSTPPVTFNGLIKTIKQKQNAASYLLLKDIFPQNAVDLRILSIKNPLYHYFRKKETDLYKLSDYIGCMSQANINYLIKNNPRLSSEKLEVCPNSIMPINLDSFQKADSIRKQYGLPIDKVICIYGGNLGKPQGIGFLLEVLKQNINRKDVYFIVVGSGTEAYRIAIFLDDEKPKNIKYFQQLPRNQFDELLFCCDIGLIFLDKHFTIPNYPSRLLNYLEFKKPILMAIDRVTDVGTIAEENNYGLWVESGDIYSFNQKLNFLIENNSLRKEMGLNGYNYLLKMYTVDKSYETIMAHFTDFL